MEKELKAFIDSVWFELSDESKHRYKKLIQSTEEAHSGQAWECSHDSNCKNAVSQYEIVGRYIRHG